MAAGPGDGDTVSSDPAGEHGRRAAGQVTVLCPPWTLRQPAAHERHCPRTRSLPGQLHSQLRYLALSYLFTPRVQLSTYNVASVAYLGRGHSAMHPFCLNVKN